MDQLNSDCLISIFQHLDLPSRLKASETCKLWRELLQDSDVLMHDIYEVTVEDWNEPMSADRRIKSLAFIFSNIDHCSYLTLRHTVGLILSEAVIKQHLFRFGTVRLSWYNYGYAGRYQAECLAILRGSSTIRNLSIDTTITDQSPLDLSGLNYLELLEIVFTNDFHMPTYLEFPQIPLPPSIRGFTLDLKHIRPTLGLNWANRFLESIENCPLLEDLKIGGRCFDRGEFPRFLNLIRNRFPKLRRLCFRDMTFVLGEIMIGKNHGLPLEWVKFEYCTLQWFEAAQILIKASNVKTVVIMLKTIEELPKIYELAPLISAKNATLELTTYEGWTKDIAAPIEFNHVLTKLELKSVYSSRHLKSFFIGKAYDKLTEIKLDNNISGIFGDKDLALVAEWCLNLEKLSFMPGYPSSNNMFTDQAVQPFFHFWDNRESRQLSIVYLITNLVDWFQGPVDQEKGVMEDGKRWLKYRKWAINRVAMRIVIWDDDGKKMVIRDYDKDTKKVLQICLKEAGCCVKVMAGP